MKEKEKGKSNPFIKELRPDEEILWLWMRPPVPRWSHLIDFILRAVVTILFFACAAGVFLSIRELADFSRPIVRTVDEVVRGILLSFLASLRVIVPLSLPLVVAFYVYSWESNTRKLRDAYAVTNQRLLLYKQDNAFIQAQRLDEIEALRAHKHAVTFVQTFAPMGDVEEVAHLMGEARNRLLEQAKSKR
jgi:hypothetical protein